MEQAPTTDRRHFLVASTALLTLGLPMRAAEAQDILDAVTLDPLRAVIVARDGEIIASRGYNGYGPESPTNIKSASKSVISALVGIAINRGVLAGTDQRVAPLLRDQLPVDPDPQIQKITIGHLLSMQAGLERMSGPNYGAWVSSGNWVRTALAAPFVAEPGGAMQYSTASTHLLSAILAGQTGRSTLALARDWLGPVEHFAITGWERDPQGIHLGGNQMAMSTRSLLAFGELYRRGGTTADGARIIPQDWIEASWTRRTRSQFHDDGYGYGWFLRRIAGDDAAYAWGYGGQMLYVLPGRAMTIAITSDPDRPSARTGYRDALHALAGELAARAGA